MFLVQRCVKCFADEKELNKTVKYFSSFRHKTSFRFRLNRSVYLSFLIYFHFNCFQFNLISPLNLFSFIITRFGSISWRTLRFWLTDWLTHSVMVSQTTSSDETHLCLQMFIKWLKHLSDLSHSASLSRFSVSFQSKFVGQTWWPP